MTNDQFFQYKSENEISYPVVHINTTFTTLPIFPNKCYISVLSHQTSLEIMRKIVEHIGHQPSLVVIIDTHQQIQSNMLGEHHEPWVRYVPSSSVITVTCSGDGIIRRGLLWDLKSSLGHFKDVCTMRNKELRIACNVLHPFFVVKDETIDMTTLESPFLQTFLERFSLHPSFHFAQQKWGSKNKSSGIWNGVVGMVRKLLLLILFYPNPY